MSAHEAPAPNGHGRPIAGARYAREQTRLEAERREVDRDAAREEDDFGGPELEATRPRHRQLPDLVDALLERAAQPFVAIRLTPGGETLFEVPPDGVVGMGAPTGGFKTTTATQIATTFAREQGISIYGTLELGKVEIAARIVAQRLGVPWRDPLTGRTLRVDIARALDVPRLAVIEGADVTLPRLEEAVRSMRAEFPGMPVLVVIDYLGLMRGGGEGRDERNRIAAVVEQIRAFAIRLGVVVLLLMQMSRANARAVKAGELLGAETTATGAESGAIEHACAVTLSLGSIESRDDGNVSIALSVGKNRFGVGDRVFPIICEPASGAMELEGAGKPASLVRTERAAKVDDSKVRGAKLAIPTALAKASEPMSRAKLRDAIGGKDATIGPAVLSLIQEDDGGPDAVVEVRHGKRGKAWPVWVRAKALAAGLDIVPRGAGGTDA